MVAPSGGATKAARAWPSVRHSDTERLRFELGQANVGRMTDRDHAPQTMAAPADDKAFQRRWSILAVLVVSLLIVVLDNTILNVALKTIQLDLRSTQSQLIWAVNSYVLVFAALLFTWGVLGDRYGRRKILMTGMTLFGIASAMCAFSATPDQLIFFRALMGIGGAAVLPVTLAIITNVFPPNERGRAIGVWAGAVGVAVAIGPITGGFLLEHFWWGSVFLINVPIVLIGLVGIALIVPESTGQHTQRLDPIGVLLSIAGLLSLVYGIVHGGDTRQWSSPSVWGWILLGVALLTLFIWLEMRSDHPSLDVHLFRNREFSVSIAAVTMAFFGLMGATFFLVFYLQLVRGYSPLQAGLIFLPLALGQVIAAPRSAKTVARFGPKLVIGSGLLVVSIVFTLLLFVQADTPLWVLCVLFFFIGAGMGNAIAPATTVMMSTLPLSRAGAGSAVQNTVRQVGGALGVAILGTVLATVYAGQFDAVSAGLPAATNTMASGSLGQTYEVVAHLVSTGALTPVAAAHALSVANDAFMSAMHVTCLLTGAAALAGAIAAYVGLPDKAKAVAIAHGRQQAFEAQTGLEAGPAQA
jgi:DHA2 family multidrug resistance protein-like MFS transporter